MRSKVTLAAAAAVVTAAAALVAAPQSASAMPQLGDSKQVTKSNVEQAGYRYNRRHWRRGHYYGHRRYYRRPGFGVYLGF
jgi:hypothetical protein